MCRTKSAMLKAIANLDEALRDFDVTTKRAVFVRDDANRLNMVSLFAAFNREDGWQDADFFDVRNDGTISCTRYIERFVGMGNMRIARESGLPNPKAAIVVRV